MRRFASDVEGSGIEYDKKELEYNELGPCACGR